MKLGSAIRRETGRFALPEFATESVERDLARNRWFRAPEIPQPSIVGARNDMRPFQAGDDDQLPGRTPDAFGSAATAVEATPDGTPEATPDGTAEVEVGDGRGPVGEDPVEGGD